MLIKKQEFPFDCFECRVSPVICTIKDCVVRILVLNCSSWSWTSLGSWKVPRCSLLLSRKGTEFTGDTLWTRKRNMVVRWENNKKALWNLVCMKRRAKQEPNTALGIIRAMATSARPLTYQILKSVKLWGGVGFIDYCGLYPCLKQHCKSWLEQNKSPYLTLTAKSWAQKTEASHY